MCPRWSCDGVGIPVDTKKKFSFGKALVGNTVGGFLMGPAGAVLEQQQGLKERTEKRNLFAQNVEKKLRKKYNMNF